MTLSRKSSTAAAVLLVIAAQCIVYFPAVHYSFLKYDDDIYVYENTNIQSLNAQTISWMFARPYYRSYTPVALLSHAMDYSIWKDNPWGHHLMEVLLHTLDCVLLFFFARFLLRLILPGPGEGSPTATTGPAVASYGAEAGALATVLLFSLHPLRAESVSWISDRKDLLLVLFLLPCLMAYFRYDRLRGTKHALRWYLLSLVLCLLAALSKSIATMTPLLLLGLDAFLLHRGEMRGRWGSLLLEKIPFFLLSIGFGVLAIVAARGSQLSDVVTRLSPLERFLMPFYTIMFYPAKVLVPFHLTPTYDSSGVSIMIVSALGACILTVAAALRAWRGRPLVFLAWVSYVVTILPTITGLGAGIQPWADRYSYLPSLALFLLAGGGISMLWSLARTGAVRILIAAGVIVLSVALGFLSRQQMSVWKDGETLWRYAVDVSPRLPMTYANLGVALESQGEHGRALEMYRKAIGIQPHYADALYNMALTFEQQGLPDSAEQYYVQSLMADTTYGDAYVNLGNLYVTTNRVDQGILLYHRALSLDPADPDPYYNLGYAYFQKGDRDGALEMFKKAVFYSPGYAKAYYGMGIVYLDGHDENAALSHLVRAARLGSPEAQKLLRTHGYTW